MSGDTLFVRLKEGTEVVATVEWATREYAFLQAQERAGWPDESAEAVQVLAGYIVPKPVYYRRGRDEEAGVPSLVDVVFEMVALASTPAVEEEIRQGKRDVEWLESVEKRIVDDGLATKEAVVEMSNRTISDGVRKKKERDEAHRVANHAGEVELGEDELVQYKKFIVGAKTAAQKHEWIRDALKTRARTGDGVGETRFVYMAVRKAKELGNKYGVRRACLRAREQRRFVRRGLSV